MRIANSLVKRILVDTGAAVNIMPTATLKSMNVEDYMITPCYHRF